MLIFSFMQLVFENPVLRSLDEPSRGTGSAYNKSKIKGGASVHLAETKAAGGAAATHRREVYGNSKLKVAVDQQFARFKMYALPVVQ